MVNAQPSGLYRTYFRLTDIAHDLYRVRGTPYHYLQITTKVRKRNQGENFSEIASYTSDYGRDDNNEDIAVDDNSIHFLENEIGFIVQNKIRSTIFIFLMGQ